MSEQDAFCNIVVNFAELQGDRILPYQIALDLQNSNLLPAAGENQKICYLVTGVGAQTSAQADLSQLVLGLCNGITEDQIERISVSVNDVEQEAVLGKNVELLQTDAQSGGAGLRFRYGLSRAGGRMSISLELNAPYPIGPVPITLYGENASASGLTICGPVGENQIGQAPQIYEKVGLQTAIVSVPVTVTPFAHAGKPKVVCCGDPVITSGAKCPPQRNKSCRFIINQKICVLVPVAIGATAYAGEVSVDCCSTDFCGDCCGDCCD